MTPHKEILRLRDSLKENRERASEMAARFNRFGTKEMADAAAHLREIRSDLDLIAEQLKAAADQERRHREKMGLT